MGQKLSAAGDALLKESWQQEDEAEEQSAKGKAAAAHQLVISNSYQVAKGMSACFQPCLTQSQLCSWTEH
jgi:hypothetical protein